MREALPIFIDEIAGNVSKDDAVKACFPQRTYFVDDDTRLGISVNLRDFFGDEILEKLYIPQTGAGKAYWREILPAITDLVKDHSTPVDEQQTAQVINRMLTCQPNYATTELHKSNVKVVSLGKGQSRSPVLRVGNMYIVNKDHPYITTPGFVTDYGIQSFLLRQWEGDEKAEDKMIEGGLM